MKYLYLPGNDIRDAGLVHLRGMEQMESLSLNETQVTGRGFAHLARMKTLKKLRLFQTPMASESCLMVKHFQNGS